MANVDVVPEASVHGRFQPPHLAHLEYILEAKRRCRFLWIGLAQYDLWQMGQSVIAPHRSDPASNPLSYFERVSILTEVLEEAGVSRAEFGFVPFPIETPDRIPQFVGRDVPCYTTICDDWNRHKVTALEQAGFSVTVLWQKEKTIEGRKIREAIASDSDEWKQLVPPATQRAVEKYDLKERLLSTSGQSGAA